MDGFDTNVCGCFYPMYNVVRARGVCVLAYLKLTRFVMGYDFSVLAAPVNQ